ncbi:hypothetical protein JHK87_045830 [Glycine soja]|nr:hypothetical protein JHK87_045830 [Glycine soja]
MTKVHPNANASVCVSETETEKPNKNSDAMAVVLTVWKKSLLPNCNGFTVFDTQRGNLVFRVDNYVARNKDQILLMDAAGTPLLTIRRKRLSLVSDTWLVFEGEGSVKQKLLFTAARKNVNAKCTLAHIFNIKKEVAYEIEGSYAQRCCTFYNNNKIKVAEMKMKETFGADIFRLFVQPHMDTTLAMAFVILLDHIRHLGDLNHTRLLLAINLAQNSYYYNTLIHAFS